MIWPRNPGGASSAFAGNTIASVETEAHAFSVKGSRRELCASSLVKAQILFPLIQ